MSKGFKACLAALSAISFPTLPTCPGTQQNKIWYPLFERSLYNFKTEIKVGEQESDWSESRTLSESV